MNNRKERKGLKEELKTGDGFILGLAILIAAAVFYLLGLPVWVVRVTLALGGIIFILGVIFWIILRNA